MYSFLRFNSFFLLFISSLTASGQSNEFCHFPISGFKDLGFYKDGETFLLQNDGALFLLNLNTLEPVFDSILFDNIIQFGTEELLLEVKDEIYILDKDLGQFRLSFTTFDVVLDEESYSDISYSDRIFALSDGGIKVRQDERWKSYVIPGFELKDLDQISSIEGELAYTGSKKLITFEEEEFDFKEYNLNSEPLELQYNSNAHLWILDHNGIKIKNSKIEKFPEIEVRSVFVNGIKQDIDDNHIYFDKKNNDLLLNLNVLHFIPGCQSYYYLIEGMNDEWLRIGQPSIKANIPEGNYKILVKVESGNKFKVYSVLDIRIKDNWIENLLLYLIVGAIFLIVVLVLIIRKRKYTQKLLNKDLDLAKRNSDLLLQEIKTSKLKISPHFLFNALNNIQGLIALGQNKMAKDQLRNVSLLMRQVLDYGDKEWINVNEDANFLKRYLMLENLNHNNSFEFDIKLSGNLKSLLIPPLLTQIPVENAIIHGIAKTKKNGQINIIYNWEGNYLEFRVMDNGPGLSGNSQRSHSSKGLVL